MNDAADTTLILPASSTPGERLALRVMQAGLLAVVLVATTYRTFELDRFFVPKELVLHLTALLAGLLALGGARRGVATRVDVLLSLYLVLGALSAALATNHWLAARALGVSVSGVVAFWVGRVLRRAGLSRGLVNALALAVVLAAATALAQTYGVRLDVFSINRAPGGTLGNRNFIAHLAAFGFPVVLLATLRARAAGGFLLGTLGIAISVAALVLTRSRAAWLGLAGVLAVLLVGVLLSGPLRRSGRIVLRVALVLALAAGGVGAALALPNTLRWKDAESPYLETARGVVNYREGSGAGRLVQYRTSLGMALRHPLLGVGPGNWAVRYPAYASSDDPSLDRGEPGTTSNPWPSSDWVAFLSERGLPAFVVLALAWVGVAVAAWRRYRGTLDPDAALASLALLAVQVGVSIVGSFDAAMLLAWPALFVWSALGALWSPDAARRAGAGPAVRVLALLGLALASGASALRSAGQVAAMHVYAHGEGRAELERAARLDPGSYRVHLRLARGGARASRCEHARAAHALLPSAEAARAAERRCR